MDGAIVVGNWALPLLYLGLLLDYGATFFLRTRTHVRSAWLPLVIGVHGGMLALRAVSAGRLPIAGAAEILSVLALAVAVVYGLVELTSRDRRTGVFVVSLAFLAQYTSSILLAGAAGAAAGTGEAASLWGRLHVMPALVSYTAMGFAGVYGLLYLVAQHDLRERRFGVLFDRLPPLDLLGRMTWHALLVGFIFMTLTIATGPLVFGHGMAGGEGAAMTAKIWSKVIAGSGAWLIAAAAILGRWIGQWPPGRVAAIAVAGFGVTMALLGASALLS